MIRITERSVVQVAVESLKKSSYQYVYVPNIAPDSDTSERNRFEDELLLERLQSAVGRITQNKAKTSDTKDDPGLNNNQIRTLEKIGDTLLPKLMGGEAMVKLEQQVGGL